MNTIEKIRNICKEKGIAVSKVERDLGFSNGYINSQKKGRIQFERLVKISGYLRVPMDELVGDDDDELREIVSSDSHSYYLNDETKEIAQEIFENKDMKVLFDVARKTSPEHLKAYTNFLKELQQKEQGTD